MTDSELDADFRDRLSENGYAEIRRIGYEPHHQPDLHTHDFDALGIVTEGALTIVLEDSATTYHVGDVYDVPAGTRHAEHTSEAATSAAVGIRHRRDAGR